MIGGNTIAEIQTLSVVKDETGEAEKKWTTKQEIAGWLDLSAGDSKYATYDAKIQESTHIFISDCQILDSSITSENSRMIIENKVYDIMLIDDPMNLHKQLEIYLKYTGG